MRKFLIFVFDALIRAPSLAIAAGAAMLIVGALATDAGAAGLATTFPLLGSTQCVGRISNSPLATVPNGDYQAAGVFGKRINKDVFPSTKDGKVTWVFGVYTSGTCKALDAGGQPALAATSPCIQTVYGTGDYSTTKTKNGPIVGAMNVVFSIEPQLNPPSPPQGAGSDPFEGCSATFAVFPFGSGKRADMTLTGLSGTCPMSGTKMNMVCSADGT